MMRDKRTVPLSSVKDFKKWKKVVFVLLALLPWLFQGMGICLRYIFKQLDVAIGFDGAAVIIQAVLVVATIKIYRKNIDHKYENRLLIILASVILFFILISFISNL